jgi:hypothetical protein
MKRRKSKLMYSSLSLLLLLGTTNLFTGQAHAQFSSPVHDVDDPDRQPVAVQTPVPILITGGAGSSTLITVLAGKRLVVDYVAGTSGDDALRGHFVNLQ